MVTDILDGFSIQNPSSPTKKEFIDHGRYCGEVYMKLQILLDYILNTCDELENLKELENNAQR